MAKPHTLGRLIVGLVSFVAMSVIAVLPSLVLAQNAPIKSLGRFEGWRDNALVGYGIVVGLSGTGDSPRSTVTRQALQNVFSRLGTVVGETDINARNVAVVLVTATLPASANVGDRISVTVSSAGDARSLAGGVLLMTPLAGPDRRNYALAQGSLVVGGYSFEDQGDRQQRNLPTTARIENGATVELPVEARLVRADGSVGFLLNDANFATASRIADAINSRHGMGSASAIGADEVRIMLNGRPEALTRFLGEIGNLQIIPDRMPRIVINERTGTVVAGSDVTISSVVIAQGDLRISVKTENQVSQPGLFVGPASGVSSLAVTNSELVVTQGVDEAVVTFPNSTVADLVQSLNMAKVDTRRIIAVLQAMHAAGALNAEIVVQ
ncbi:flagellar basal body P-ring protein FlgI [Aquidulcibacter sp.]|jgi:flagellar P-ring protein precursor FlgI|uniref:flagellar basal body P-ring protein FlgI n=1 Tax=Aquidulcibacter sp. TaxID=2052990 RepID=UPI0037BFCB04